MKGSSSRRVETNQMRGRHSRKTSKQKGGSGNTKTNFFQKHHDASALTENQRSRLRDVLSRHINKTLKSIHDIARVLTGQLVEMIQGKQIVENVLVLTIRFGKATKRVGLTFADCLAIAA